MFRRTTLAVLFLAIVSLLSLSARADGDPPAMEDGLYLILGELSAPPASLAVGERARYVCFDVGAVVGGPSEVCHLLVHRTPDVPLVLGKTPEKGLDAQGKPKLQLLLSPMYARQLERFTASHIMNRVLLVAGKRPVTIHKIREPISGGRLQITRCTDNACESIYTELLKNPASSRQSDGPKRVFQDQFIQNLAGDWNLTRSIRGEQLHNWVHAEWVLNHQFLQLSMRDVAVPPSYEALVLIGFDPSSERYVAHWCDTYGGKLSAVGFGKRLGDAIEFTFQYPDGPFYNTFSWNPNEKGWTFRMEAAGKDGKRMLFAQDSLRRP
ncbi:MAG: hypothetical protein HY303_07260 [Candidatus Wallbacteria bacterium]|nr:hypothetical protein [Candidatus Wallbacteria bacterium]